MSRVLVPLAKGFEEIEAVTIIDVLRRGGVEVLTASLTSENEACGAHGLHLRADARLEDVIGETFDAIVLPGGGEGTERLCHCAPLLEALRRQNEAGRIVGAICAAPLVLAEAGVLPEGIHLTCYPGCERMIRRNVANVPVVSDGHIVTGQAPGASLLFALVVLQLLEGRAEAAKVAAGLVTDVLR